MPDQETISQYADAILQQFTSGHAGEHAYRPALERLVSSFEDVIAVNDPKRSAFGNPDFVFLKNSNRSIILGYAEAKDIAVDLDKTVKTEQLRRYAGYEKLFLTNGLDFRFFRNGELYQSVSIGKIGNSRLIFDIKTFSQLKDEIQAFLELPPESIRSGKKLAVIMGGKARRIRDNVAVYLSHAENEKNQELEKIFDLMREMLVHDLTSEKFADMYAQTLVYGLFVARYNDKTPASFDRKEARDLVPKSNPFLRHFFDHIVGPDFDTRLTYIVDELCEVFSVSDVGVLIQKHLRLFEVENEKDPIIHFYEDFLKEYDPEERKRMGAYYTPIPVVRFIIRQVDEILKQEFGIARGLADDSKIGREVEVGQDMRHDRRLKLTTKQQLEFHRVQVLDPAVGTATFLNEAIKHIAKSFEGQEGRWPNYVEESLLDRLHGFELMMAPYTIAHLKLGITLQETGVEDFNKRIGVYLTNALQEGISRQQDLFTSFGLAQVVTEEGHKASEIKNDRPIMAVIGNPPYSITSSNLEPAQRQLIQKYKYIQGLQIKERGAIRFEMNLNDDYVKFIAMAENLIEKNGEGVVAFINNNNFIDAPTFRGMRWHLSKTFDKIYVLNLHGNSKKKEVTADGGKDENVFSIQTGVSINIFVRTREHNDNELAEVYTYDILGTRAHKFSRLSDGIPAINTWRKIEPTAPNYEFIYQDHELKQEYMQGISMTELFPLYSSGIITANDKLTCQPDEVSIRSVVNDLETLDAAVLTEKYKLKKESKSWLLGKAIEDIRDTQKSKRPHGYVPISYRPFDTRCTFYTGQPMGFMNSPRYPVMQHFITHENVGIMVCRQQKTPGFFHALVHEDIVESGYVSNRTAEIGSSFPLYAYHDDGSRTANMNPRFLKMFTANLKTVKEPEEILDYVYAILHSRAYRLKYEDFLKQDFPRIPVPPSEQRFEELSKLGKKLRMLHLMKTIPDDQPQITFSKPGTNEVETIKYLGERVWINDNQYFGNVPEIAWSFWIGAYQPAQKWLKDRKGLQLTGEDIVHYQNIIIVLSETNQLMQQIDNNKE